MPKLNMSTEDRFWSKVGKGGEGDCWEWKAGRFGNGYGHFTTTRAGIQSGHRAHRFAWVLATGPIPEGLCVLHKCDNRPCCNPQHLFLGTDLDNARDRDQKGRGWNGWGERGC